jgi:hypothetical protein
VVQELIDHDQIAFDPASLGYDITQIHGGIVTSYQDRRGGRAGLP